MLSKRAICVLVVSSLCGPALARADELDGSRKHARVAERSVVQRAEAEPSYQRLVDHVTRMGLADEVIKSFAADPSAMGGDPCTATPNGCGPSGFLSFFANCPFHFVCFEEACNEHDLCYATCGANRLTCDVYFVSLMWSICDETFRPDTEDLQTCQTLAFIYFMVVFHFGEEFYNDAQEFFCSCDPGDTPAATNADGPGRLAMAPPFVDDDRDLLPDRWERAVGLNVGDIDSFDDSDGDGLINLAEFIHGMDPFNADTNGDGVDDATEILGTERTRRTPATRR